MPRLEWLLAVLLLALALPGCKRLTFIKPDPSHRGYTQVAPDYNIRPDRHAAARNAAAAQLADAERALQAGNLDHAQNQAREALRRDPRSDAAHTLLALIAEGRGQSRQAGEHYARALALAPNRGVTLNNRAVWLCNNGQPGQALPLFQQALADPTYPTPLLALANSGSCALAAGDARLAETQLRQVLGVDPANAVALEAMATLSVQAGRAMDARAFIQRRLDSGPATPKTLALASQIESILGDNSAATRYRDALKRQFPQSLEAADGGRQR